MTPFVDACAVAEAHVDVNRARRARHNLLARGRPNHQSEGEVHVPPSIMIGSQIEQLTKLVRYERRALSRRKFALRAFDAARVEVG